MDDFGRDDPRGMPVYLFHRSIRVDYGSAVRANPERQYCSICPRYWYVDATFRCERCGREFVFTTDEQRVWYEDYGFWIDSLPKHCHPCRRNLRALKATRQEYDRAVEEALRTGDLEVKKRLAHVIDLLYEQGGELPVRIHENRKRLARQIARSEREASPHDSAD